MRNYEIINTFLQKKRHAVRNGDTLLKSHHLGGRVSVSNLGITTYTQVRSGHLTSISQLNVESRKGKLIQCGHIQKSHKESQQTPWGSFFRMLKSNQSVNSGLGKAWLNVSVEACGLTHHIRWLLELFEILGGDGQDPSDWIPYLLPEWTSMRFLRKFSFWGGRGGVGFLVSIVWQLSEGVTRKVRSPEPKRKDDCKLIHGSWEPNSCPLRKQQMLLVTKPSLQPWLTQGLLNVFIPAGLLTLGGAWVPD